jgi:hypothetical protein
MSTTAGQLLRHYLGLALAASGTRRDADVHAELDELATAIDHQGELEREIGRLRTRLEHLEQHLETVDTYLEQQARK